MKNIILTILVILIFLIVSIFPVIGISALCYRNTSDNSNLELEEDVPLALEEDVSLNAEETNDLENIEMDEENTSVIENSDVTENKNAVETIELKNANIVTGFSVKDSFRYHKPRILTEELIFMVIDANENVNYYLDYDELEKDVLDDVNYIKEFELNPFGELVKYIYTEVK